MKIIKSFRKSISMKIDKAWEIIIKAPLFLSKKKIEDFVNKNKSWVEEKTQLILDGVKKYIEWEKFMYFWEDYELKFSSDVKNIDFDWKYFYIDKNHKNNVEALFEYFYKKEARTYIQERTDFISKKYNLEFNKFKITSAKTRWWSCSSTRNISFSYRLIMAPIKTIDYVIVHELAHLNEMNHSKNFWNLVEKMMSWIYPWDYKVYKKWLSEHWNKLIF